MGLGILTVRVAGSRIVLPLLEHGEALRLQSDLVTRLPRPRV
jgi:hypothetical protein